MPDQAEQPAPSTAAASLRDTAKWLVGGIAATAAGVLAGTSLTHFGSLDPGDDTLRFSLAIVGLALGFLGLGWLMIFVLGVLTVESVSLGRLGELQSSVDPKEQKFKKLADQIFETYRPFSGHPTAKTLAAIVAEFDTAKTDAERTNARKFSVTVMADAKFLWVRERFRALIKVLPWATMLAALGFGLFAWAANPAEKKSTPPAFSLSLAAG